MALAKEFGLGMPAWFDDLAASLPEAIEPVEDRVGLAIELSRRNLEAGTGGPFGAGVFERDTGRIVSLGVNRVMPTGISSAHAEVMALSLAQQALGQWDLGGPGLPAHQLVVNWQPCAMCFGAVLWSGVVDLVLAGTGPELEALTGFDEGPIHPDWQGELVARGITLTEGVRRDEAVAVLAAFGASGAVVYNARGGRR